jgi:DNA-binding IclR family transcriptional regulator
MQNHSLEVQSLQRALDILEVIGDSAKPVTLKVITESTGLPKSTVYRLLSNLEVREYIRCNNDGFYELGIKLLMMSQRVEQNFELKHLARPYLMKLNETTKETVHLGMLEGSKVVYVDTFESPHSVRLVAKIGDTTSVHYTSLGKALLIEHTDGAIRAILEKQGMDKKCSYTLETPDAFLEEMQQVRKLGYSLDNQESGLDCLCIGAPIRNYKGQVVGAISVSGPISRFTLEYATTEVANILKETTQQISKMLGYKTDNK